MGANPEDQRSGGIDVQVQEIQRTGERLAAAVETLAFKKAHLKDEAIEVAERKADGLLLKAEDLKDQLVAKVVEKIPDRRLLKEMTSTAATKVLDTAVDARDAVIDKAGDAQERAAAVAAQALPEVGHAAADAAERAREAVSRAGQSAVTKLTNSRFVPGSSPAPLPSEEAPEH